MAKKSDQKDNKQVKPEKTDKIVKAKKYKKTWEEVKRIQSSKRDRIYLLNAQKKQNNWVFTVQGTKLSNYSVSICESVKCTCMDFRMKQKPCKHIYFIVTQVAQNNQITDYFRNSTTISKNAFKILNQQLQLRLKSRLQIMGSKKDIDLKDDTDCTICFSQMDKQQQTLEDCHTCKKFFHKQCIQRWKTVNPSCPLCRSALLGTGALSKLQKIVL